MVDQLWMWVLGTDLIVTSFPQRWDEPRDERLNVFNGVMDQVRSRNRRRIKSVYELAMIITGCCVTVFDRLWLGDDDYQFMDMFESTVGDVTDQEADLFALFSKTSAQASLWLKQQQHSRLNHSSPA